MTALTRTAWVTGGNGGIGRAVAARLSLDGYRVAIHCRTRREQADLLVDEITRQGRVAHVVCGDLSMAEDVARAHDEIRAEYGSVDLLVNNAGSMVQRVAFAELTERVWDEVLDANLRSTFLCCKAVVPGMVERRQGKIVNVSSMVARTGGSAGALAYATSKGAVSTFTRGLAFELAAFGIRVNGVAPGIVSTEFQDRFAAQNVRAANASKIPAGREGSGQDVAGAVSYLASEDADYLVGEIMEMNGGLLMP